MLCFILFKVIPFLAHFFWFLSIWSCDQKANNLAQHYLIYAFLLSSVAFRYYPRCKSFCLVYAFILQVPKGGFYFKKSRNEGLACLIHQTTNFKKNLLVTLVTTKRIYIFTGFILLICFPSSASILKSFISLDIALWLAK